MCRAVICGVTLSEAVEPSLPLVSRSSQTDLLDVTERTCTYHCLCSRFYVAATVLWTLRGPYVSLVMNDLCGIWAGWIPADFTLHMWDLLHGHPSCPLVTEPLCKGLTSLRVIPSSQTKSLLQISVFFFCLFEGMHK